MSWILCLRCNLIVGTSMAWGGYLGYGSEVGLACGIQMLDIVRVLYLSVETLEVSGFWGE